MKKQSNCRSKAHHHRKLETKIEQEQYALMLSLHQAQQQIRTFGRYDESGLDPLLEQEKEGLVTKCNYYRHRLNSVKQSLSRMRSGKFGICASCGEEISEKRLVALPTALFCLECQQAYEHERAEAVMLRA